MCWTASVAAGRPPGWGRPAAGAPARAGAPGPPTAGREGWGARGGEDPVRGGGAAKTRGGVDVERLGARGAAARHDVDGWSTDLDRQWARALYVRLVALAPDDILDFDRRRDALRRTM